MAQTTPTVRATEPVLEAENLDRGVGFIGLLWSSEGSIIGSGWLFGALTAASIAGPSVLIAWGIASVIIIFLALVHAELGGLFPVSGGTSRFPHYAFGSFAGATFGWFSYLQAASVAPIEVEAVIQYASTYSFAHSWFTNTGVLSGTGIAIAIALMAVFVVINVMGIRWLAAVNNAATWWKVAIPVLTIIVLLATHFHGSNLSHFGGFFVKGAAVKSILVAIPAGGIVFSLLGFEQAVQLGGEARNPKLVPRAVIVSILIGGAIYILVQLAFIGALEPSLLAKAGTWTNLANPTAIGHNAALKALNSAPFYSVASFAGIAWLATILRIDAIVSPGGTGLIYLTSSSRILFGLSKNGYVPEAFEKTTRTRVPVWSILISFVIGLIFLLPFPSWAKLVSVVTSASVMMYAGAPLAFGALRLQKPDLPRPYRMPAGHIMAPLSFVLANLIVYWSGWGVYSTLMLALLIGFALFGISYALNLNRNRPRVDWDAVVWVIPWLVGLGVISYLGQYPSPGVGMFDGIGTFKNVAVGGTGAIPFYWDLVVVAGFSLAIYYMAIARRLPARLVDKYVEEVYPPPVAE